MQIFKIVVMGTVDRFLAFDELPEDLLKGITVTQPNGFPRAFKRFVDEEAYGKLYTLEIYDKNQDKETWKKVTDFVTRAVDVKVRLADRIEDMAKPCAKDCTAQIDIEPEDIQVIPIPFALQEKIKVETVATPRKEEGSQDAPKKKFICEICGKEFAKEQALRMHKIKVHPKKQEVSV